jgi:hypothetical protein
MDVYCDITFNYPAGAANILTSDCRILPSQDKPESATKLLKIIARVNNVAEKII